MGEAMRCVVFFSGGLSSWAAAKRAAAKYGAENVTLLFTDTLIEDPDLYRFLDEAAENVGARLVRLSEGRTPWQGFRDEKVIGNTRIDPCSKILKRKIAEKWLEQNFVPAETVLVFGVSWDEAHRYESEPDPKTGKRRGVKHRYADLGWPHVEAPLLDSPWLTAWDVRAWARLEGLTVPRLYSLGFSHNNCGGFCVKAGEGHFAHLLKTLPEVYAKHEAEEEAFNATRPGRKRQTVLAPEREINGKRQRVPISLREFREQVEAKSPAINLFDVGGCDCFYPTEDAA